MAKKSKETSTPLVFSLVFFILTTIAFGVMWYLAYSDQETMKAEVDKNKKDAQTARSATTEAELLARTYRLYIGIGADDDESTINGTSKSGDKIAAELTRINSAVAKGIGKTDAADLPDDLKIWPVDSTNKAALAPKNGLIQKVSILYNKSAAYDEAKTERDSYAKQIEAMKLAKDALKKQEDNFKIAADNLPNKVKDQVDKATDTFEKGTKKYEEDRKTDSASIKKLTDERDAFEGQVRRLTQKVKDLEENIQILSVKASKAEGSKDSLVFDEPQGKILRVLGDGVVEINLGSAAGVKPGLTFTVQPSDFPSKGRQSRLRTLRVEDGRGGYKSIEVSVPRAGIEVYEVVGPNLSLARYTRSKGVVPYGVELDPLRDGVVAGDLLYNLVWRKGVADHVALIGIFDINGDGVDDILSVVRDLTKMGITVDAYYDMKKRMWIGQVTERTRFVVEGFLPINTGSDPLRDQKTKLLGQMNDAIKEARLKGVESVNHRDFFSRMGYKFRLDVTDDKINSATGPYLSNVDIGAGSPPSP